MKVSQSTRILLLLGLVVAAVAVWYSLFAKNNQAAQSQQVVVPKHAKHTVTNKPVMVTTSARALQVLPIPFLVTEAPEEAPVAASGNSSALALANTNVPPNPFVPIRPPKSSSTSAQKPAKLREQEKPVTVTPPSEGLAASMPVPKTVAPEAGGIAPPPVSLGKGVLPVKLAPLAGEIASTTPLTQARPEEESATETNTGSASDQNRKSTEDSSATPEPNPLKIWAAQQDLQLSGVALGPVGVAIFKTAGGYLALPVGQTFPDKNVLVKTITAERVLLVDGEGANSLTLKLGGGE